MTETTNSCVSAERFFSLLAQHRSTIRQANANEPAIRLSVDVVEDVTAIGELGIVGPDGTQSSRTVVGRSCDEVADALALVAALSMDSMSNQYAATEAAVDEPSLGRATAMAALPPPQRTRTAESRVQIRFAKVKVIAAVATSSSQSYPRQQGIGVEAFALAGSTSTPWIGVGAKYWLLPGLRGVLNAPLKLWVGGSRSLHGEQSVGSGGRTASIEYQLTSGNAGLCPFGGRPTPSFRAWICAMGEVGWLEAAQSRPGSPKADAGMFAAFGALAQVETRIVGWLILVAGAGVVAPLTRYRTQVDSLAGSPEIRLSPANFLGTIGVNVGNW
ncbi:MAG TPA: hypothetical protein VIV60_06750 [Polyangiaceae bacterium]